MNIPDAHDVYFIRENNSNSYKIGKSSNIPKRLKTLQTANANKLLVIATCSGGKRFENFLHQKYRLYRHEDGGREWFNFNDTIVTEVIKDMELNNDFNYDEEEKFFKRRNEGRSGFYASDIEIGLDKLQILRKYIESGELIITCNLIDYIGMNELELFLAKRKCKYFDDYCEPRGIGIYYCEVLATMVEFRDRTLRRDNESFIEVKFSPERLMEEYPQTTYEGKSKIPTYFYNPKYLGYYIRGVKIKGKKYTPITPLEDNISDQEFARIVSEAEKTLQSLHCCTKGNHKAIPPLNCYCIDEINSESFSDDCFRIRKICEVLCKYFHFSNYDEKFVLSKYLLQSGFLSEFPTGGSYINRAQLSLAIAVLGCIGKYVVPKTEIFFQIRCPEFYQSDWDIDYNEEEEEEEEEDNTDE